MSKLDISVLYVEDEHIIQLSVASILRNKVRKLYLAPDGKSGYEKFLKEEPDIVMTDIQMPIMDGLEMLRKIKEKSEEVRVIILSAFGDTENLTTAIDIGVDKFLIKPIRRKVAYKTLDSLARNIRLERQVREEQKKFRILSSSAQDAIFMVDNELKVTLWNNTSEEMFGYKKAEIIGKDILDFIIPKEDLKEFKQGMANFRDSGKGIFVGQITELKVKKRTGDEFIIELSLSSVKLGGIWHAIGIVRDITEKKKAKVKLQKAYQKMDVLARTDFLTKLSSRWDALEKINYEMQRFKRFRYPFTLIISDVDSFKSINDTYGHGDGDHVLQHLSGIMKEMIRKQDVLGRWGGEEFIMMLPRTELDGAKIICERIREKIMSTPYKNNKRKIEVTMTFGIALYDKEMNIDDCIKQADHALYYGKRNGKNCVVIYDELDE